MKDRQASPSAASAFELREPRFQLILDEPEGGAIFNPNQDGTEDRPGARDSSKKGGQ